MPSKLDSPLSGRVTSRFGGSGKYKSKIIFGVIAIALIPSLLSTFAASVTVGTGPLEFGQGSQQAIACDDTVYIALGEEWHPAPTSDDSSNGFFRIRTATISNLDLEKCVGRKIRMRLIDNSSNEVALGPDPAAKVLQVTLPNSVPETSPITDVALTYLDSSGQPISGSLAAQVALNISGNSVYDGSTLSASSSDLTFYLDPSASLVNIDGSLIHRATVETTNNPN